MIDLVSDEVEESESKRMKKRGGTETSGGTASRFAC